MGLDAYLVKVPADFVRDQPWVDGKVENDDAKEVKYWRKHGQLQNWMHARYLSQGGANPKFNCANLRLWEHDIEKLISDLENNKMPDGAGFFFGDDAPEKLVEDLAWAKEFLKTANFSKWAYFYSAWY
jgi:hypothetical protein